MRKVSISIFKKIQRQIRRFFYKNFNKKHRALIREAKSTTWYDFGPVLTLLRAKLEDMIWCYEHRKTYCVGAEERVKQMKTAVRLINICVGDVSTFEFSRSDEYFNSIWLGGDFQKRFENLISSYRCLVQVNTRNAERFFTNKKTAEWSKTHQHELYEKKAWVLLWKYLEHHLKDWWD